MKIAITGGETLAAAARECCAPHFALVSPDQSPDLLWCCHDTPIDGNGVPNPDQVMDWIAADLANPINGDAPVLVSSQMPVGTTRELEKRHPGRWFAHSPENIRVATAAEDFADQARVIVGVRDRKRDVLFRKLFAPFTANLIFCSPETAEMAKHALNVWLGVNIAYVNEVARICDAVGADADVVSLAIRTDRRSSPHAPLRPGRPYGGGHLARDVWNLSKIAKDRGIHAPIIAHVRESNDGPAKS